MSIDEGHVNQAEFPEAAAQQAREDYSADSDSYGEKDPFKLKKEKKDAEKKKKEKGYKSFEAESFSEEDDDKGKGKKRPSILFRGRFNPSTKSKPKGKQKSEEKDGRTEERRPSKDKTKEEKKEKGSGEDKKRSKSKDREKLKKKAHTIDIASVKAEPVFGVPFASAVERTKLYDNIELPRIVRECIDYVEESGLTTPGIYRLSGVKSKVDSLMSQYNNDDRVNLRDYDPTIITSLLKQYLRELPQSVLTTRLIPAFDNASAIVNKKEKLAAIKSVMAQMPSCNYTLLSWLIVHLVHVLDRKEETKMTIQNLSIVMCPTMRISHRLMNILLTHSKELFADVQLKRCPKPLEWHPGVFEMPETTTELEEELLRHEAILAKMHEELNKGIAHKNTEDHLWEVQRVVTQLKRKLRVSRRVSETRLAAKEKEIEEKEKETVKTVTKERSPAKTKSLPPVITDDDQVKLDQVEAKAETTPLKEAEPEIEVAPTDDKAEETLPESKAAPAMEETKAEIEKRTEVDGEMEKTDEGDMEMMKLLLLSQAEVVAEQEELMNIRNELQKRIENERLEIAKLQSAISEAKLAARRRGASVDSIDSSVASESSSESDDEDELQRILEGLIRENEELQRKNMQLSYNIHNEREACAELRVQIKLQEQMPQMLEALAQVVPAKTKTMFAEPKTKKTQWDVKAASKPEESVDKPAAEEVPDVAAKEDDASVVSGDKKDMIAERHLEETAL